ncbi:hypothetical protein E8E11_004335 [Didymella keratinophila]|nr:hypothetical protein E8E11_004335 [Didymella keratinophila]
MPLRQKISVCAIFATGSFVCAVAIRRTTLLQPLMTSKDYTWAAVEQFQWCFAEVNAAIVCACAPAFKPFFARYLPGLLSSHFRSDNRDYGPSRNTDPKAPPTIGSHTYDRSGSDKDAYELQWRDDVSEDTTTKRSGNDDEARLWKGNTSHKFPSARNALADRAKTVDEPSMETYVQSGASSPAPDAALPGGTLRYDTSNRIHVTSETSVTYN